MPRPKDTIDRKLLALLSVEARLSTSEIARRLHVARSTVNERIVRLEASGVILGYRAVVARDDDPSDARAFVQLDIDRSLCTAIVAKLRGFPEIRDCVSVSGSYPLMCIVQAPCAEDVDALIDDLVALDGVRDCKATLVLADKFDRVPADSAQVARHLSLAG